MSSSAGNVLAAKRRENQQREKKEHELFGETLVAGLGTYWRPHICMNYHDAAAHVMGPPIRPDPSTPKELLKLLGT